jgi:hypothetical protein
VALRPFTPQIPQELPMFRRCLLVLAFLILLSLLAAAQQTPQASSREWREIASLPPGSQLLVRQIDSRVLQPCTLAWIDNTALACDIFVPAVGPRRVVYPIASVASVTQQASPSNTHPVALFVGMAIGGTIGGIAASNGGVRDGIGGGVLGAFAGGGIGLAAASSFNPRPQPQFGLRVPLRAPRLPISRRHY